MISVRQKDCWTIRRMIRAPSRFIRYSYTTSFSRLYRRYRNFYSSISIQMYVKEMFETINDTGEIMKA